MKTLTHYNAQSISFDTFSDIRENPQTSLEWHCLFVLPFWLKTVGRHLGEIGDPLVLGVFNDDQPIGLAPFAVKGSMVRFMGNPGVCDYQDMLAAPGSSLDVVRVIIDFLKKNGLNAMDLGTLRPDAKMLDALQRLADDGEIRISMTPEESSFETALPETWESYLGQLNGKQRHEVRRKIRRLEASGSVGFHMANKENQAEFIETFLTLFRKNRQDKAEFMSDEMAGYFTDLIQGLAHRQMLRLFMLTVDRQPAATALCFDYDGVRYLYNSGYDAHYDDLSVGVLCKVFSIQHAIETGCRRYDFLKGAEIYKKRIGGQEVSLCRCRVEF